MEVVPARAIGSGLQNYTIIEISKMLPKFYPCKGEITSVKFIERIDQLKHAYRLNEIMTSRIKQNELVIEYYYRMLAIGHRGNIDDSAIIKYIINGITDEYLHRTLTAMNFLS